MCIGLMVVLYCMAKKMCWVVCYTGKLAFRIYDIYANKFLHTVVTLRLIVFRNIWRTYKTYAYILYISHMFCMLNTVKCINSIHKYVFLWTYVFSHLLDHALQKIKRRKWHLQISLFIHLMWSVFVHYH